MKENKVEKAIGLRVSPGLYEEVQTMCSKLGNIPINQFALNSLETSLELLKNKSDTVPKWIAVGRFALDYDKKQKQ